MNDSYYQIARRRNSWFKRLQAEWRYNPGTTFFCTLTYSDDCLPCDFDDDGLLRGITTSKRDCQLFMKKVRRYFGDDLGQVRYFLVSEFGDQTQRPHYHLLLFTERKASLDFIYKVLFKCWSKGYILDAQYLKGVGGIKYLTNYISKQFADTKTFSLMSRNPGIGCSYVESKKKFHRNGVSDCCLGCKSMEYFLPAFQKKPDVVCFEHCPKLRRNVDKLKSRFFYVLGMSNIKVTSDRKPTLPRYYRTKIYTELESKLLFNDLKQADYDYYYSLSTPDQIAYLAQSSYDQTAREELCRRRDRDFTGKHNTLSRKRSNRL